MNINELIETKDFKTIVNYKTRFITKSREDIRQELICRILENPTKNWTIYSISNELNKIISPIIRDTKYISETMSGSLNNDMDFDFKINDYNENGHQIKVNKKTKSLTTPNYYKMEFNDFNYYLLPLIKNVLKLEEYLLFKYHYCDGDKISEIKKATKLPITTLTYIHKNLKSKLKIFLKQNPDILQEIIDLTKN